MRKGLFIYQQTVRFAVGLFKLFIFNVFLVFVGFFACSAVDRMFGLGTVNKLMIFGVILAIVTLMWRASHDKT